MKSTNKIMYGGGSGDALSVRGRSDKREFNNKKSQSRLSKSRNRKPLGCFICHKEGNFKRNFPKMKKRYKGWDSKSTNSKASVAHSGYDSDEALTILNNYCQKDWILDSRCSYHMTPYRECFLNYKTVANGMVFMGNNQSCEVKAMDIVILKLRDELKKS